MLRPIDVKIMDKNSEYYGVKAEKLMDNAGKSVADYVKNLKPSFVLVFIGPGNNGGDGIVAARYLSKTDIMIRVVSKGAPKTELAANNFAKLDKNILVDMEKLVEHKDDLINIIKDSDVIIDSLFGVGVNRPLRSPYSEIVQHINQYGKHIISVDVPSGLGQEIAVKPHETLTFVDIKTRMNSDNSGNILIKDIGVPEKALTHTGPGEIFLMPIQNKFSHKGDNGKLLIIGGGEFTGAPAMAGMAALRTGCDLVTLLVPDELRTTIASYYPELMVKSIENENIEYLMSKNNAVLIGPGIGNHKNMIKILKNIEITIPAVIDTSIMKELSIPSGSILTPHDGEFARLTGISLPEDTNVRKDIIIKKAYELNSVIVSKGVTDIITDGINVKLNDFGNPGMTVGGTGDVLSGVISALRTIIEPFDAAVLGTYLTTVAGDISYKKYGRSLISSDVINSLPEGIMSHWNVQR